MPTKHVAKTETFALAALLCLAVAAPAFAQGSDVLGVKPVADAWIYALKLLGLAALAWAAFSLSFGFNRFQGIASAVVGVLFLAKTDAVAQFLGLNG